MKEWSSPWNSFNSTKALLWKEQLEGCANLDFLPPVTVDINPSNICNYDCPWCNAYGFMQKDNGIISKEHLKRLADFFAEWGVQGVATVGGGEPLMNQAVPDFLQWLSNNKLEAGIITNGSLITDRIAEIIAKTCRWAGISVDAGSDETYKKTKGIKVNGKFDKVLDNIKLLCGQVKRLQTDCRVCYKYLLHPMNAKEILMAVRLAKELGVNDFHIRPVGWENVTKTIGKPALYYPEELLEEVDEQIAAAMELEDDDFKIYGIRHKFAVNFDRRINFTKCRATPLLIIIAPDGNCHLCVDLCGKENMILCSHYPDPHEILKYWNSDRHKEILQNIDINKCPRCVIGPYNEIVEHVIMKDNMSKCFL